MLRHETGGKVFHYEKYNLGQDIYLRHVGYLCKHIVLLASMALRFIHTHGSFNNMYIADLTKGALSSRLQR